MPSLTIAVPLSAHDAAHLNPSFLSTPKSSSHDEESPLKPETLHNTNLSYIGCSIKSTQVTGMVIQADMSMLQGPSCHASGTVYAVRGSALLRSPITIIAILALSIGLWLLIVVGAQKPDDVLGFVNDAEEEDEENEVKEEKEGLLSFESA